MELLNSIALGFIVALALLLGGLTMLALRRPILSRIGARNIPRRPLQSVFIVIGLTMSTTIFITSLSLGDTLNHSLQRQVVEAYGQIDQVVSPPFLQALLSLSNSGDIDPDASAADAEINDLVTGLAAGDLQTILQLLQDGLPGIDQERYLELQQATEGEALIDGLSGVIFFPTIIRNMDSGQGEPLGFIFAVDDSYEEKFGLYDETDHPVSIAELDPGIGDVFAAFSTALNTAQAQISQVAEAAGLEPMDAAQVATIAVAGIALLSQPDGLSFTLDDLALETATLKNLGVDTALLEEQGIEVLSLEGLGLTRDMLLEFGLDPAEPIALPSLSGPAGAPLISSNVFASFNLNTLATDVERILNPVGLQVRQGEVFLSQVGAVQLDAQPGDVLEAFIGPIPLRFRVQAIVKQAGPLAPLVPVIVLELEEAQKLLFMSDRINAALVSNAGDELTGINNTDAVHRILQTQAFNAEHLAVVQAALQNPTAVQAIRAWDPSDGDVPSRDDPIERAFAGFLGLEAGKLEEHLGYLDTYLDTTASGNEPDAVTQENLRVALGNPEVRNLIQELPLPASERETLRVALQNLNDFEVLMPLNKRFALRGIQIAGVAFSGVFWFPGSLSIMAGAILIFLIFVMLAAERQRELGILRAMGMSRGQIVQMFITEGMLYDLAAALLGLGLGLLVAYSMVGMVSGLFTGLGQQLSGLDQLFNLRWSVTPASLTIAYCLGVIITGIVVIFSSWRVSRMNIVAAIRELEETSRLKSQGRIFLLVRLTLGILLLAGGTGRFWPLYSGNALLSPQLYETLLLSGSALLVHVGLDQTALSLMARRQGMSALLGFGLLGIWALPWLRGSVQTYEAEELLTFFLFSGPSILIGAILAIMGIAQLLARGIGQLGTGIGWMAPAIHLAIAYPLNHRFRTGVTMLLFSMVITSVVVMTQFIQSTESVANPGVEVTGGFDLTLTPGLLSAFDPVIDLRAEAADRPDFPTEAIAAMGSVSRLRITTRPASAPTHSESYFSAVGIDAGYATQVATIYGFSQRAPGFPTDADIWQALVERDDVAILTRDHPLDLDAELSDARFALTAEGTAAETVSVVQIIGILEDGQTPGATNAGPMQVNKRLLDALNGKPVVPNQHFVRVTEDADARATAQALEKSLLSSGLNVSVFRDMFNMARSMARNILRLFRGFFTLGLVVGLAGLAVISSRTVLERRQQIGTLRSIGYQPWSVAIIFVLESSFISASGILIGGATGWLLGQGLMELLFADVIPQAIPFPWLSVIGLLIGTYLMALLSTLLPAWQASRIYPAEALRYE